MPASAAAVGCLAIWLYQQPLNPQPHGARAETKAVRQCRALVMACALGCLLGLLPCLAATHWPYHLHALFVWLTGPTVNVSILLTNCHIMASHLLA